MEVTSERGDDSGIDSNADSGDNSIYIRVNIPELKIQKCLQFHNDDTVWMAKQRVLSILSKELKDSLNFGLYCPPMNGRAGKFLDEERPLKDYPLPGPIGFLEFKYKRRVYKLMQLNPRRLKQLHSRSNLKQFMEHVRKYDMEKLNRMTIRGLDPNFHEPETGETPLSVASQQDKPRNLILAIVGGGAHIDYRTRREGFTPLHRAAQRGNYDAIKVFLDLGASPNYKDIRSLTPLYHCVCHDTNPRCVELLLHDHSIVGVTDDRGWTEVHQACKNGRVQHLEHLLFYGAEMNLQNSSGNTPLHVCAVNNQEECARVLLFRGVDKGFLNFANQDAFQVAVIAGNCELGDIIKNYKEQDVVPFQELPQYNDKRRMTVTSATLHKLQRSRSDPRLNLIGQSTPSSPAPSNNSMPHFLANGTFFDPSGVYQNVRRSKDEYAGSEASMSMSSGGSFTGSYVSDNGPMMRSVSCDMLNTYNNDTSANSRYSVSDWSPYVEQRRRPVPAPPSRTFICTYPHTPQRANELPLAKGDFVQVLGVGESGYWEGRVGPYSGCFPSHCVQEVLVRSPGNHSNQDDQIVLNKSTLSALTKSESRENTPTSVRLHKGKNGFGFVLRGAKSQHQATSTLEFKPTADFPALQYLDRVDRDSMADRAGLKAGDFLLEINGESVVNATHEHTVSLIKHAGDTLDMKVVTVKPLDNDQHNQRDIHADGTRTLPLKKKAPKPPSRDPQTSLSRANQEHALTAIESFTAIDRLDRTLAQYDNEADRQSLGTASDSYVMNSMAAARGIDPNNKTASISRRTKRLSSTPLDGIYERQGSRDMNLDQSASNQQRPVVSGMEKIYASPQEARVQENGHQHQQHLTRVHLQDKDDHSTRQYAEISPNVTNVRLSTTAAHDKVYQGHQQDKVYQGHHQTADGIYAVPFKHQPDGLSVKITDNDSDITAIPPHPHMAPPEPPPHNRSRNIPPPPVHAPPSSPHSRELSQVVPIQTQQNQYANVSGEIERQRSGTDSDSSSYESSFRPGTNARMSIDPKTTQTHANNHSRNSSGTSSMSSATSHSDHISGNGAPSSRSSKSSLTVAADVHHSPQVNQKFYEPEPDYEKSESPRKLPPGDIASLRSVREAWSSTSTSVTNTTSGSDKIPTTPATNSTHVAASSRTAEVLKSSTHDTAVRHTTTTTHSQAPQASRSPPTSTTAATKSPTPPPPPTSQTPTSPRHTDDNVMSAFGNAIKLAALARDKRQQDEISKPKAQPPPPAVSAAAPPAPLVAMAAPGIPPPPPPPSLTPSSDSSPVVMKRSLPPHIQKQLDETKKREESHNALMAAVAKRRNVVETIDMGNIADTIETRIQRGKKLQTIVYKSDQSKPEVKTTVLPAAPLLQLDQARPDTEEKKPEEKTKKTTNHHLDDKVNNNTVSKENGASPGHVTATQKASNMDFLAAAEKARQDYLQKKQQATLERKTGGKSSSGGTHDSPGGTQDAATTVTSPKPPANPEPKTQAPLGNLAHIIAQRAIQRQKSSEGVLENHNNNNASSGEPTNRSTTRTADWSSNSLEIHGATTDYSQTETPRSSRTPSFSHMNGNSPMSVSARKKMFEADRARAADNVPPLVIPPPQDFNPTKTHAPSKTNNVYGGHAKTHDGAINSKSSRHHHGNTGVHNGIGNHSNGPAHMVMVDSVRCVENGVVDVDFIPPPPLFDTEHAFDSVVYRTVAEDSVSMVSSLSTLSTLSSAEDSVDSPIHSASYNLVPPPPPGFDDSPSTSLSASMEFIPPPFEFDTPVNSPEPMSPLSGTLKNIIKSGQSHSISYPAMRAAPPGGAGHQDKPIEAWTQSDVSSWLESLQLHEHQGHFAQGNITGQMLIQLDRHRLISLGVNQVGHRMAIERAIKKAVMKH